MNIKNIEELKQELADMLLEFDLDCRRYHTNVYLYINEDGTGKLAEFINVGNNSWLDDDHYNIYTDEPHYDRFYDTYSTEDLLDILDLDASDFDEDDDDIDIFNKIIDDSGYLEEIRKDYLETIDTSYYYDQAQAIFDEFERRYEYDN